jgi:hypothetical protein
MVENVEMEKARTLAMLVFTLLALQMATIGAYAVYGASSRARAHHANRKRQ